jgi:hypothetical protein
MMNFMRNLPEAQQNTAQAAIFLIVIIWQKAATQLHEIACYKTLQAVIECGSDAKTEERRGEVC